MAEKGRRNGQAFPLGIDRLPIVWTERFAGRILAMFGPTLYAETAFRERTDMQPRTRAGSAKSFRLLCLAALVAMSPALSEAGPRLTYETGGERLFSIEIEDGWMVNVGFEVPASEMPDGIPPKPRVVSLIPDQPDRTLWIGFWSPHDVTSEKDLDQYLKEIAGSLVQNGKVETREELEIDGEQGFVLRGKGMRFDLDMEFSLAAIELKGGRYAVLFFIGQPGERAERLAALSAMLQSVRSVEGGG